jgi:4-hydroxy-4-methyl-2-oxoglutarate aldolase
VTDVLDPALLEELRTFSTPSIANGIETFDVRPHATGYMDATVRCMFPELGVVNGYAATATIRAAEPGDSKTREVWAHMLSFPAPRLVVVQDLDRPPGVGSYWGEVNANIHQAFGGVGVITDGCVRDLDEMRALGFHAFAASVCVSHAYVHVVDVGVPVTIGGLTVEPGDVLQGDQHGVIAIPQEIAADLPDAIRKVESSERNIIDMFRAPDFDPKRFTGDVTH